MFSLPRISSCAIALALSLAPLFASADEPSVTSWAEQHVDEGLVKPLARAESERARFSRARLPPRERRVRVVQTSASVDAKGRSFVSFAVDVRFGSDWTQNDIVGCTYVGSGEIYVKRGDEYRPASFLLGKNEGPVPGVCVAAPKA